MNIEVNKRNAYEIKCPVCKRRQWLSKAVEQGCSNCNTQFTLNIKAERQYNLKEKMEASR